MAETQTIKNLDYLNLRKANHLRKFTTKLKFLLILLILRTPRQCLLKGWLWIGKSNLKIFEVFLKGRASIRG